MAGNGKEDNVAYVVACCKSGMSRKVYRYKKWSNRFFFWLKSNDYLNWWCVDVPLRVSPSTHKRGSNLRNAP